MSQHFFSKNNNSVGNDVFGSGLDQNLNGRSRRFNATKMSQTKEGVPTEKSELRKGQEVTRSELKGAEDQLRENRTAKV